MPPRKKLPVDVGVVKCKKCKAIHINGQCPTTDSIAMATSDKPSTSAAASATATNSVVKTDTAAASKKSPEALDDNDRKEQSKCKYKCTLQCLMILKTFLYITDKSVTNTQELVNDKPTNTTVFA